MIPTTWNEVSIMLLDSPPDWHEPVRAGFEFLALSEAGLSNREARRPLGATLRAVCQFQTVGTGSAATRLAAGLRAWQTEPIAIPFWPAAVRWSERETAPITSRLKVAFTPGFDTWTLFEDSEPGWPAADDLVAPVLLGSIARNDPVWLTPLVCRFSVDFEESSANEYALGVAERSWESGPQPSEAWSGDPPLLLPFRLVHEQPLLGSTVEMERERLGFGRQPVETLHPQANYRRGEAPFVEASADEIAAMIRFFVDHGEGRPFWAPSWAAAAILASPVGDGETVVEVEAGHDVKAGDWLMFASNGTETAAGVESVDTDSITLAAGIGAWPANALITHLLLCRFERTRIQVDWLSPTVAKVRLALRELPAEHEPAADETIGTTIGKLPIRAWLYELSEPASDGGVTVHRFTSFERDLDIDGDLYESASIDHGAVRHGIALDRDEVEARFAVEPGDTSHPLVRLATLRGEAPLKLTIRRLGFAFP